MRIFSDTFCLVLLCLPLNFSSQSAIGGTIDKLHQIEVRLDRILEKDLNPLKARDSAYQILARIEGWLTETLRVGDTEAQDYGHPPVSVDAASILIRILSKARSLGQGNLSQWDSSFLNLISRVTLYEPDTLFAADIDFLIEGIHELLSQIKTEELLLIAPMGSNSGTVGAKPSLKPLVRITRWLQSLKPCRELTSTEKTYLTKIISQYKHESGAKNMDWDRSLEAILSEVNPGWSIRSLFRHGKLTKPAFSKSVEEGLHRLLNTGPRLTQSLKHLDESGIRRKIFDLLLEDETRSKAQINRDWRAMVHEYEQKKGYPISRIPQDSALSEAVLKKAAYLTDEEREIALDAGASYGFGEHRAFLYSIYRVCLDEVLFDRLNPSAENSFNPLKKWVEEMRTLAPHFSKHSQLGQLVHEIAGLQNYDFLSLSDNGMKILGNYEQLARSGNIYAQQAILWMKELDSIRGVQQLFALEEFHSLASDIHSKTKNKLPESFPDYQIYSKWKEAVKIVFQAPIFGNYTQEAALSRLYRESYLRFADPTLFAYINADHGVIAGPGFQVRSRNPDYDFPVPDGRLETTKDRARYYQLLRKNMERIVSLSPSTPVEIAQRASLLADRLHTREASTYAAASNADAAVLVSQARLNQLETDKRESLTKISPNQLKDLNEELFLYDQILASVSSSELFHGKDESHQKRILNHLRTSPKCSSLESCVRQKPYPAAANLFTDIDARYSTIEYLYWVGAGKEEESKRKDFEKHERSLSLLSSLIKPTQFEKPPEASETIQAKKLLDELLDGNEGMSDGSTVGLLLMLSRVGRMSDATPWLISKVLHPLLYGELAQVYSHSKDFKTALIFFEKSEQIHQWHLFRSFYRYRGQVRLTQYAQAYFETRDFRNTLRILGHKERILAPAKMDLNFVDHELRIRALTELGEKEEVREALLAKEQYERSGLLPDLRQAARIYEEDGDLDRAKQILFKASEISRRLGGENSEDDQKELDRLVLK